MELNENMLYLLLLHFWIVCEFKICDFKEDNKTKTIFRYFGAILPNSDAIFDKKPYSYYKK